MSKTIDHIGIAVKDLDAAVTMYQDLMAAKLISKETLDSDGIEVAFLELENFNIELLSPTSDDNSIKSFLEKNGQGMHHICYKVDDINAELQSLKAKGYQLVDEVPRTGARGKQIAFIHPSSTHKTLIEICQI